MDSLESSSRAAKQADAMAMPLRMRDRKAGTDMPPYVGKIEGVLELQADRKRSATVQTWQHQEPAVLHMEKYAR